MYIKAWTYLGSDSFYTAKLRTLALDELPTEKWGTRDNDDYSILKNYIDYTFQKLYDEREQAPPAEKDQYVYIDEQCACFNTGLYDKSWQDIYFYCDINPREGYQKWQFKSFYNNYTIKFSKVPDNSAAALRRPDYFSDPSRLIFNVHLDIVPQWNHIIWDEENYLRIPKSLRDNGKDFCQGVIAQAITSVKKRICSNYKTIVPQWYRNKIQLLAPLYLTNVDKPDLALVMSLSDDSSLYYGHTCLTTEMAYNNARLIAKPESYWLYP